MIPLLGTRSVRATGQLGRLAMPRVARGWRRPAVACVAVLTLVTTACGSLVSRREILAARRAGGTATGRAGAAAPGEAGATDQTGEAGVAGGTTGGGTAGGVAGGAAGVAAR